MELDFTSDVIEKLLLKKALSDKNWLDIMDHVYDKRWFKVEYLGLILKLTLKFYDKYRTCPPNNKVIQLLVKKYAETHQEEDIHISEVNELLTEISQMNLNVSDDVMNSNLKEFIRRNAFYNALFDNAEILEKDPNNYEKVVDKCLENFDKVQKITFNDTDLGLNYFDLKDMESHWEFIRNPEAKIKTGWDALDGYTNGGVLKDGRMLFLLMAQAGLGKSVFMSNLAVNFLKQNLSVVVISLEMSQHVYAQRFDAHISQKNINKLKENETTAIQRIKDFYSKYPKSNLFIKEYPPRSIRTHDIQTYLENLKNTGHNFDVIIVDYLNLVLPNHKTDSMYKDGLSVSEELRALSYMFKVPVISAVQCNSEGMNSKTIDMQNVSESRGIVHTADFLAALMQEPEEREHGIINMRILKNRLGGQVGKICNFTLDPETLNVADVTNDNNFIVDDDDESEHGSIMKNFTNLSADIEADIEDI